jgi:amidase
MKTKAKKFLKWLAAIIGIILLIIASLGTYIWYHMPRPHGKKPELQQELFKKPDHELPVAGKFIFKSATELAEMIRTKKATSLEITQEFINYIKNNNYKTNAFVWLFEKEALDAATKADEKLARGEPLGSLHGVPVCIKEQFWIKGKYCTINAGQFQNFIAPETAAIVKAWTDEGAVILGTTNVPNMLVDLQTFGDLYPQGNNPYDTSYTCGGSTGGGASAVASGFCPLALGGDMGGSIRVPAAFCGLYGLKTSENSMEGYGTFPDLSKDKKYVTMAVTGPLARTIDDIDLSWKALIKPWYGQHKWHEADKNKKLNQYKIAYLEEWHFGENKIPIALSLKEKMDNLISNLTKEGVSVTLKEPANFAAMRQLHWLQAVYMIFYKEPWIIRQLIKMDYKNAEVKTSIDLTESLERISDMDENKYKDIRVRRDSVSNAIEKFFEGYDFLIMPVTPGPAIKHNHNHDPIPMDGKSLLYWDYFHYPMCFNLTGHPALTVPLGLDKNGLPLAVQIVGPLYSEPQLIQFAKLIQHLHDGYTKPPMIK